MKIKKTTPADLLRDYRDNSGKRLFEPCRTEQKMDVYIQAVAICPDCDHRKTFLVGLDEVTYHECNQGNRVTYLPRKVG